MIEFDPFDEISWNTALRIIRSSTIADDSETDPCEDCIDAVIVTLDNGDKIYFVSSIEIEGGSQDALPESVLVIPQCYLIKAKT